MVIGHYFEMVYGPIVVESFGMVFVNKKYSVSGLEGVSFSLPMILRGLTVCFSVTDANSSKKQKPGVVRNPTDLDVVLEAFQEFVTQYK